MRSGFLACAVLVCFIMVSPATVLSNDESYTIKLTWKNNPGVRFIKLWYLESGERLPQEQKAEVKGDGVIEFRGSVFEPVVAMILEDVNAVKKAGLELVDGSSSVNFVLENSDLVIEVDGSLTNNRVLNSPLNTEFSAFKSLTKEYDGQMVQISREVMQAKMQGGLSKERENAIIENYKEIQGKREKILVQYIQEHHNSFVSLFALKDYAGPMIKAEKVEPLFNMLSYVLRSTRTAKAFLDVLEVTKKLSVGQQAPDFTLNDMNGKPLRLSSMQGRYVLVDFWGSWCKPCRVQNPELVKVYEEFNPKGFEILGVSVDVDRKSWVDAVQKDGLKWSQVSDLKGIEGSKVAELYAINAVPKNFLLDPTGKIIAVNIHGDALKDKLRQVLNNKKS